ncbi:biotin/lipoyl-containing protein [Caproiciproducens sp. R2]|uniref:biotin/lipoyl-containing protein n=1 Tax=Caproiciproducens sp. R2 TaxID=3435187 RepID=UPI004034D656
MKNLKITVNGTVYDVQVEEVSGSAPGAVASAPAAPASKAAAPAPAPASAPAAPAPAPAPKAAVPADAELISSPMPGTIVSVNVTAGQTVKKGDVLLVLEAMKMENEIMAPHDAAVAAVHVNKGDSVDSGTPLVSLQ